MTSAASKAQLEAFDRRLEQTFDDIRALLVRKREAYGPYNLVRHGAYGIAVRASDKIDRIAVMTEKGTDVSGDGEPLEDAFKDLVGYGVLGLLFVRGQLVEEGDE